jgi:hypothetical protein
MMMCMTQFEDEAARRDLQIADLQRRVVDQKWRIASEGAGFGSLEVLRFMEQTLESWREHKRALQDRL